MVLHLAHPDRPEALHYKRWFGLLTDAGYEVAGKKPQAVFLTQLSRSPVMRRTTQACVYELDRQAPARLRVEREQLEHRLRQLTAGPTNPADLSVIRAERGQLTADIGQIEKALEEADRLMLAAAEPPQRVDRRRALTRRSPL